MSSVAAALQQLISQPVFADIFTLLRDILYVPDILRLTTLNQEIRQTLLAILRPAWRSYPLVLHIPINTELRVYYLHRMSDEDRIIFAKLPEEDLYSFDVRVYFHCDKHAAYLYQSNSLIEYISPIFMQAAPFIARITMAPSALKWYRESYYVKIISGKVVKFAAITIDHRRARHRISVLPPRPILIFLGIVATMMTTKNLHESLFIVTDEAAQIKTDQFLKIEVEYFENIHKAALAELMSELL